jgi:hypothetical protein
MSQQYVADSPVEIERSVTFAHGSFDRVWESVISFFATQQISIETVEKESGIIVAKRMLMASSNGEGIVSLGTIKSERSLLKQKLEPVQFEGSANASIVRSTGRIMREETIKPSIARSSRRASYQVAVSFNVFVARFSETEVRLTINTSISPAEPLKLWCGWYWRPDLREDVPGDEATIAMGLASSGVPPQLVEASPVSNGTLEKALLDYVRQRLLSTNPTPQ